MFVYAAAFCLAQEAQPQQFSNRYGMKMTQNEDGSYALLYAKKYAKFIDVNTIPDVMVPYTYQPDRLKARTIREWLPKTSCIRNIRTMN